MELVKHTIKMSSPAETGESMVVEREFLVKVYVNKVK